MAFDSAIIPRPGHNNEVLLAHFRMLAEKLQTKSKTQLAKLALGLRSSGLVSQRVTGSDLIDQQSKILGNFLRSGAQDGTACSPGIFIYVSQSRSF
jgi:hypothetical protein